MGVNGGDRPVGPVVVARTSAGPQAEEVGGCGIPGLVVIVSADPQERSRLLAEVPPGTTAVVAPSADAARALVETLIRGVRSESPPELCILAQERAVAYGERKVALTPLEFSMLRVLLSDPEHVWTFGELTQQVWATGYVGGGAQVRAVVKRLRRKLTSLEGPVEVETVRSAGFRLVTPTGT